MFRRDIFKEEIEKGQRKIRPYKELDITGHTYGGDSQQDILTVETHKGGMRIREDNKLDILEEEIEKD